MKIIIDSKLIERLIDHLPYDREHEQCAVFVGDRTAQGIEVQTYVIVPNRHPEPDNNFRIETKDVPKPARRRVVGVFHTHVNNRGTPSAEDIADLRGTNRFGIVYDELSGSSSIYTEHGIYQEGF